MFSYFTLLLIFGDKLGFWAEAIILNIIAAILVGVTVWSVRKRKIPKELVNSNFEIFKKKGRKLTPEDVMGIRADEKAGFKDFYFERDYDHIVMQKLKEGRNVLITGESLSGKTRLAYCVLKALGDCCVFIPVNGKIDTAILPYLKCKGKSKNIALFDDMDKYAGKENVEALIARLVHNGFVIMATCKNGHEMDVLRKFLTDKSLMIFHENMEIKRMDDDDLENVKDKANEQGVTLNEKQFNGTVGSLFYPLETMKSRFEGYGHDKNAFLRVVRKLYIAGVYDTREYSLDRIKKICEKDGIKKENHEWEALMEELKADGFVRIKDKSTIEVDEVYFQNLEKIGCIVGFAYQIPDEDVINEAFEIFADDADAMFRMGYKFGSSALISRSILQIRIAIKANNAALKFYTFDKYPNDYAATQNNLGLAYRTLAEVEDKGDNCKKAIKAYEDALRVYIFDEFPYDYAMIQNNLGLAYWTLALVEDKATNCENAIRACQEALKVWTFDKFPYDYAMAQDNLGTAYKILASVKDKKANCIKSIASYVEALRVRNFDEFPYQYAMTQNNLGGAYWTMALVENKVDNCKKAIEACEEALRVRNFDEFPYQYAMTQNNLGIVYETLAEVKNKASNCKKAIVAYQEALKVLTSDEFPYYYEMTSRNLARVIEFSKSGPDEAEE